MPLRDAPSTVSNGRLGWLRGLSIGVRLALGFGLIASLFLAANYVNRTNTAAVTQQIESSNRTSRNLDRAARELTDALTTLHLAVRELISADNTGSARKLYEQANTQLARGVDAYSALDPTTRTLPVPELSNALQSLQQRVDVLLAAAKRRDESINRYWNEFVRLQKKFSEPQQGAWRIGDRTLTRASFTAMGDALLSVRTAVDSYLALPNTRRSALINLQEENFLVALAKQSKALAAAQDEEWVAAVRRDFQRLQRLRRTVQDARETTQDNFVAVSDAIDVLIGDVRTGISEPAAQALLDSAQLGSDLADRADRSVALLSVGTLALILIISLFTARSVTIPVSRLIAATRRLGSRGEVAPVARGGARELDQLAGAFNDMATQLAAAKQEVELEQQNLEHRVIERTQQLEHLAYHDPLTGLPNRRQLFKHLHAVLERARTAKVPVVLLLIDLDNFKTLNDSLGHLFGDRVLKAVSQRLLEVIGPGGFAARLGGDEFTIVLMLDPTLDGILLHTENLLTKFQRPLQVDDREVIVGISIGAGIYPDHAQDAESLLRAADSALFKAKSLGRNQMSVSSPELVAQVTSQFKTEQALRRAIQCNEFELLYQPQVRLQTHTVTCVEALLRWQRDGQYVLPLEFLQLAEQSGLITEITDWALRRALQTLAKWRQGPWPEARVAVNISSQQFMDQRFVGRLQALLVAHNVPPASLEIELTETVLQSGPATIRTLRELRDLGVGIALDDFGAGYSSLASLEQLQLSSVKIDRSLIENIDRVQRSAQIARSMISLCRSLDLRVTAEGVERPEQLKFLHECEDVDVQGFLLSRPLAEEQVVPVCNELAAFLTNTLAATKDLYRPTSGTVSYLPRRGTPPK